MNNSILSKLTPKEPKFFSLLKNMSNVIVDVADLLNEFVNNYKHETAADYYHKIKDKEHEGDKLSNRIFNELNTTFITPFDREDINSLALRLDDVIDRINSSAKHILLYNPKSLPEDMRRLTKIICECALSINKAMNELNTLKRNAVNIKKYCQELRNHEHNADEVYENFLINLFEKEKDSIELIKLKEIMSEFEIVTDVAESVGKIIKTIIVKYA